MKQSVWHEVMRGLAALMTIAILLGSIADPSAANSRTGGYDAKKFESGFLSEVLANADADYDVIVRAKAKDTLGGSVNAAAAAVKDSHGKAKHALHIVGGVSATVRGKNLLALSNRREVDFINRDAAVRVAADLTETSAQATTAVGGPVATTSTSGGAGVGVAVIDSGVYAHRDLAGRIVAAIDFTSLTPTVSNVPLGDLGGHGTHVAGIIAGDGTVSGGLYKGVAPAANIIDVRVIDANGNSNTSLVLRGMQWVMANKNTYNIRVVNMSLGAKPTGSYKQDVLATAVEVMTFAGIAVVVSAGNTGPYGGTITSPATDPFAISVGAFDDNGTPTSFGDDLMAAFSSRGKTAYDGLSKPDLVASGRKVVSLRSPLSSLDVLYPDRRVSTGSLLDTSTDYYRLSGTSMAAPYVAGVIALMVEKNPTLTPLVIKKRLKSSAVAVSYGTTQDRGAGRVDAASALASISATKEYAESRVTDSFAKDMRKFIQGQPVTWKSTLFNNGVDSKGIAWEAVTWENITWDAVTWENITWEAFTWENITWENITWEAVTWESSDQQTTGAQSGTAGGWTVVD